MNKIKYCIWDIGQTIYEYSLDPLHSYLATKAKDIDEFNSKKYKFSYNEYMKGNVSWDNLCISLCEFYQLNNIDNKTVEQKFFEGIGEYFSQSQTTINFLHSVGIKNGILSNALPVLSDTVDNVGNLDKSCFFPSYELGLLKPDVKIYKALLKKLGVKGSEVIFIDDKAKNVAAAKSLGINGIVYDKSTIEQEITKVLLRTSQSNRCKSHDFDDRQY